MRNLISKNVGLIKILSVVLFVALMAFNVVVYQNASGNTSVDLSLSGLKAMAFGGGEGGGGGCTATAYCYNYMGTKTGSVSCSEPEGGSCSSGTEEVTCTAPDGDSNTQSCS